MFRMVTIFASICSFLQVAPFANAATDEQQNPAQPVNAVIEWNRTLLTIVRTPGAQSASIHSTRNFAILHAAIYDAVNNIHLRFSPYLVRLPDVPRSASEIAAADEAAHDVLVFLYPAFQMSLDTELQQDLAQIPDNKRKTQGVAVGQAVASQLLAARSADGANVIPPPYVPGNQPGDYQLTPPNFAPADFTQWPQVTPFALEQANEFRPGPPPTVTSAFYTEAFNEVKSLGFINSTTRTAEQTQIGQFWNGNIQDFWNEIAQTAALQRNLNLEHSARLFALLNISLADTAIAFFEAKYTYNFWRPVTAIRLAATDGNPQTDPDPTWLPLGTKTAPDPSYPGAHSAISKAGATVLGFYFGDRFTFDVTSESLAGVTRHFTSFSAAAEEAGLSRIFAGQHFRTDHVAGKDLGGQVAESIDSSILVPEE
ncbi:MAG TPA: vanadium-dependent haloperoxidase [Pyrinomonadaceae bacterium]|nr:vanadium-dependent haloperoxidase [Pyrinomonadaceae bacterium]